MLIMVVQIILHALLLKMPLYTNITGRMAVYWLAYMGVSFVQSATSGFS